MVQFRATTIVTVRRGDDVCIAGDGQVTMGETAIMKAGAKMAGKMELGIEDLTVMLHEAVEGIKMRGKSTVGEQTMLDAMVPALEALKETGSLKAALVAAEAGVEKTKGMIATKGRASYLGERSLGHQDPGATSFTLLLSVIARYV